MAFDRHDPAKPVRVRVHSPLSFYPQHPIVVPGARLLICDDLVASAVEVGPPEAHGIGDEHYSELEFLALEETRFLAGIALAVHPDDGKAFTYPLFEHVDVALGLDNEALIEAGRQLAARISERKGWSSPAVLPPARSGPAYRWREAGVNVARVRDVVRAVQLNDHLLMRGLLALLRADMCWRHREIAEAGVTQLYVALDVSFQMVLRILRERGVPNPSALDAGALIDEVFNPEIDSGSYFQDYYEVRIKTMHPSSRFGVFAVAPLAADEFHLLRCGLVEVYHWLITNRVLEPGWRSARPARS